MEHEELVKLFQANPKGFFSHAHDLIADAIGSAPEQYQGRLWAIQETWDRKMANVPPEDRLKVAKQAFADILQGVLCPEWR